MRRAGGLDGAQPDEPADAVVDMHDEIAGGEARRLRDEVLRPPRRPPRPHQPVAEDVLLADHRGVGGLEPAFEPEHGQPDLRQRQALRLLPGRDRR